MQETDAEPAYPSDRKATPSGKSRRQSPEDARVSLTNGNPLDSSYLSHLPHSSADCAGNAVAAVLDLMSCLVMVLDTEGRIEEFNVACEKLTGYMADEVKGKPYWDILIPADRLEHTRHYYAHCLEGNSPGTREAIWVSRDGAHHIISWTSTLLRDASGTVQFILAAGLDVTEHRRIERDTEDLKDFYERIIESIADAVFATDAGGHIMFANEQALLYGDILSIPLVGMHVIRDFPGGQWRESLRLYVKARKTLQPQRFQGLSLPSASESPYRCSGWMIPMVHKGKFDGMICTFTDDTKRWETERALRESEEMYRQVVETAEEGIWIADTELVTKFVNAKMASMLGYEADEMLGQPVQRFVPMSLHEALARSWNKRWQSPNQTVEGELLRKDGQVISVLSAHSSLHDAQGRLVGGLQMITDITALKTAERALRESETRFRTLVESIEDGVLIADLDQRIEYANPGAQGILGRAEGDLVGYHLVDFAEPESAATIAAQRENRMAGKSSVYQVSIRRPDGSIVLIDVQATPLRGTDGRLSGSVGVFRDVTKQRQAEERLLFLSFHDTLTSLYNRAFFETEMARLEGSRSYPITIVSIDVDGLKSVNDTLGHKQGDDLLRDCAILLKRSFRKADIVARVGGDEFGVLLPETSAEAANDLCLRLMKEVENHNKRGNNQTISISVGHATADTPDIGLEDALRTADQRMYTFKKARRGERTSN